MYVSKILPFRLHRNAHTNYCLDFKNSLSKSTRTKVSIKRKLEDCCKSNHQKKITFYLTKIVLYSIEKYGIDFVEVSLRNTKFCILTQNSMFYLSKNCILLVKFYIEMLKRKILCYKGRTQQNQFHTTILSTIQFLSSKSQFLTNTT